MTQLRTISILSSMMHARSCRKIYIQYSIFLRVRQSERGSFSASVSVLSFEPTRVHVHARESRMKLKRRETTHACACSYPLEFQTGSC